MSGIAVDTVTDTIYAAIRYSMGGREGLFIIPDPSNSFGINIDDDSFNNNSLTNGTKFIPLCDTGPEQVLVDDRTNTIYASLEYDNFIAVTNRSTKTIDERIILQEPRAMSINPFNRLLYVASGDNHWFNVIDTSTNKVIATNTQIACPIASAVDTNTGRVFVADCHSCNNYSFTNGTSIYDQY